MSDLPNFLDDPGSFFNAIGSRPASRDLWALLGGTTASQMKVEDNPQLCALFLRAAAQQMPAGDLDNLRDDNSNSNSNNRNDMEMVMVQAQLLFEILEAVGHAAAKCNPRQAISQSGMLRALVSHPRFKSSVLTEVQVEFCQVAILAEQYRFAARVMKGTWPRPSSTSAIRNVLRYFLLRGTIHIGCNDWMMATRCFWTCLSVPSEIVSALGVAAWKKLVLVQCMQMEDDDFRSAQERQLELSTGTSRSSFKTEGKKGSDPVRGPLSLPKALPNCFSRFLSAASSDKQQQQRNQPEDIHHSGGHMVQEEVNEPPSFQPPQQADQQPQQGRAQQQYAALGIRVYMDLVKAFVSGDRDVFHNLQLEHENLLQRDGNLGLVRQCGTAMFHRQVYQLSRMFSVIPLTDLTSKLRLESPQQTKVMLEQLSIEKSCSPSKKKHSKWPDIQVESDGMVVFTFGSSEADQMMAGDEAKDDELDENLLELIHLHKQVEKLDVSIATSPMYHSFLRRAQESKMGPRGVEEL